MEIIHCLLWARNGEITVIGHNDGKNELLKIAGKKVYRQTASTGMR